MSITKSQTEKIGSIFNGNRFVIPTYQRKYSWSSNETVALWKDIEESAKDNMNHFIGTLSFKENVSEGLTVDTIYEIIDGQQRITTLFILLKVLIDKIQNETSRKELQIAFIGDKGNLKITPLGEDGDFLNTLLFEFGNIDNATIHRRSQKYMYETMRNFISLSNSLTAEEIERKINFIRNRIEVLVFNVESQAQAVKMFSIINDRGLPLRILDKTKSILMLYSTLHLKEILNNKINDSFEKIFDAYDEIIVLKDDLGILTRLEENTIFSQHYYSSRDLFANYWNNRDAAETIFDNIKRYCEDYKDDEGKLMNFIADYLDDFELFTVKYLSLIKQVAVTPAYHKPFLFLEFSATLYPLIVRLFIQGKLDDILSLLETIEVRVYKLRGTNPIADMYWLASYVTENNISIEEIRTHLNNFCQKFVYDHLFKAYLEDDIYGNGAVKYILAEYNNISTDIFNYKNAQVEHIFSKDPNYDVAMYGFTEDFNYEKNRLGNLCLLEQSINVGVSNLPPINKVNGYLQSSFIETRNTGGQIQNDKFDKTHTDNRRQKIIDFCVQRFSLD